MTRIVDFIFLIFAAFLGKKALLLSVFAFAPSVLANDIPLATLSVDNIQVRAEWNVVGDDANHFRIEGGTLMLRPNISGFGYPEGNTITAIVEVRDKFSTLNPSYEDLTVRVMITAVIMGCGADWYRNLAKAKFPRNGGNPPNQIAVQSGTVSVGDVIARRYTQNGYNHIALYTVSAIAGNYQAKTYITTSPSLYGHLTKFDTGVPNPGYTSFPINESADCFAKEIETLQEQQQILQEKTDYLNVHAPLISGFYAGLGRTVTVGTAFVYDGNQHFYLYNVTLANLLNEIYTPKVIIDDGKVFSIDNKYQIGNRYEYVANLTVGSDSVQKTYSHEVIVLNHDCPPIYEVNTAPNANNSNILVNVSDLSKVKAYAMPPDGKVYKASTANFDDIKKRLHIHGYSPTSKDFKVKFSDHFLCGTE